MSIDLTKSRVLSAALVLGSAFLRTILRERRTDRLDNQSKGQDMMNETTSPSDADLYEIGYQDGHYHAENATGQTTRSERSTPAYRDGYTDGRTDRRNYLISQGRKK